MARVNGFFDTAANIPLGNARGLVRAKVGLIGARCLVDVTFEVDTGTYATMLLDHDFLACITALSGTGRHPSDPVLWLRSRPHLFRDTGRAWTVGGQTATVYRIMFSWLWVCHPNGSISSRARIFPEPHATFSAAFLSPQGQGASPPRMRSLLGRDVLNAIQTMNWDPPSRAIKLVGV
jgi:hypothetical protein